MFFLAKTRSTSLVQNCQRPEPTWMPMYAFRMSTTNSKTHVLPKNTQIQDNGQTNSNLCLLYLKSFPATNTPNHPRSTTAALGELPDTRGGRTTKNKLKHPPKQHHKTDETTQKRSKTIIQTSNQQKQPNTKKLPTNHLQTHPKITKNTTPILTKNQRTKPAPPPTQTKQQFSSTKNMFKKT